LQFEFLYFDVSGIPDVHDTILSDGNEMIGFSFIWRLTIDLDCAWDEFDVGDVGLVGLINVTHDELLHLNSLLLLVFVVFIAIFVDLGLSSISLGLLLASLGDNMLLRAQIP